MPYVRLHPPDPSFLFFFTHCDKLFADGRGSLASRFGLLEESPNTIRRHAA
jgi:hypothetical protein